MNFPRLFIRFHTVCEEDMRKFQKFGWIFHSLYADPSVFFRSSDPRPSIEHAWKYFAQRPDTCIICRFLAFTFALNMREGLARESRTRFHTLSRVCAGIQYTSGSNDGNKGVEASLLLHFRKKPCLRRHPFSSEWYSVLFLLVLSSLSSEGSNLWEGGNDA